MTNFKSLISGIGDLKNTKQYYDNWAKDYESNLENWNYKIPLKIAQILKKNVKYSPKNILDLACGTGLFGVELKKIYKNVNIFGSDISSKSIQLAKEKKIYKNLKISNFENKIIYKKKFEIISLVGAMTYCKKFDKLFSNVQFYLLNKGYFVFSHRIDLWEKQNFDIILSNLSKTFDLVYKSNPNNYLPKNKDFSNKIKVRLVLLKKR